MIFFWFCKGVFDDFLSFCGKKKENLLVIFTFLDMNGWKMLLYLFEELLILLFFCFI